MTLEELKRPFDSDSMSVRPKVLSSGIQTEMLPCLDPCFVAVYFPYTKFPLPWSKQPRD